MNFEPTETVASAAAKIQRRQQLTTWVGAAYAGYLAILAAKAGESLPSIVSATLVTLIILGVALLSYARVNFEYYLARLSRSPRDLSRGTSAPLPAGLNVWPSGAEAAYRTALIIIVLMAALLLVALWLSAVQCTWPDRALFQVHAHCAA